MVREVGEALPNTPVPEPPLPQDITGHDTKYRLKRPCKKKKKKSYQY